MSGFPWLYGSLKSLDRLLAIKWSCNSHSSLLEIRSSIVRSPNNISYCLELCLVEDIPAADAGTEEQDESAA